MKPTRALRSLLFASSIVFTASPVLHAAIYYWDDNAAGAGFGTAGASTGTWAGPTAGPTAGWSLSPTGANTFAAFTTGTGDQLNFGNGATGVLAGTITVSGAVSANSLTFGSASGAIVLSGGTSITLGGTTPTITVNNATDTISTLLAGTGGFTKAGTGILVLSNTGNTLSGGITIGASSGTITANTNNGTNVSGIGANAISIGASSTLNFLSANTLTTATALNNTITGTGLLKLTFSDTNGSGASTTMSGLSGFTGTIELANSTASNTDKLTGAISASGAALIIDSGSQLFVSGAQTFGSINVQGVGNGELRGAIRMQTQTLTGNITLAGSTTIAADGGQSGVIAGTITSGAAGGQTLTLGTTLETGTNTFNGAIGGGTSAISVTNFAGTNTLSAANTYTGTTTISGGTLILSGGNGTTAGTLASTTAGSIVNNATLQLQANVANTSGGISTALTGTGTTNQVLTGTASTIQLRGDSNVTFFAGSSANGFSGGINNTSLSFDVNQLTGAGTTNAFTFGSTTNGLQVGNPVTINVTGGNSDSLVLGPINYVTGANTLTLNPTSANLSVAGFGSVVPTTGVTLKLDGTSSNNFINGVIANSTGTSTPATAVTKSNTSTWTLSSANTYTGITTISAGTLKVSSLANGGSNSNIGAASNAAANLVLNGGTLQYTGNSVSIDRGFTTGTSGGTLNVLTSGQTLTTSGSITTGNGAAAGGLTLNGAGTLSLTGSVTLNNTGNSLNLLTGSTLTTSGTVTNAAGNIVLQNATLNVTGGTFTAAATTALGNANNAGGTLNVSGGLFNQTGGAFLLGQQSGANSTINLNGGTFQTAVGFTNMTATTNALNFNGGTFKLGATIAALFDQPTRVATTVNSGGAVIDLNTFNVTIPTNLLAGTGTGGLTVNSTGGGGTLSLSGAANTYTGATSVTGGTLAITATTGTTPLLNTAITVSPGATFAVKPGVAGTVSLGNSAGAINTGATLNLGSGTFSMVDGAISQTSLVQNASFAPAALTLNGGTLNFDVAGPGSADKLAVTGTNSAASVSGTNLINLTPVTGFGAGANTIISTTLAAGGLAGTYNFAATGTTTQTVAFGSNAYVMTLSSSANAVTVNTGAAAALSGTGLAWTGQINGTGTASSSWDTLGGNTNWSNGTANGSGAINYANGNAVTFQDTNAVASAPVTNFTVNIQAAGVTPTSTSFTNTTGTYTVSNASGSIGIAGSGGLTKSGGGTVTLSGANTFSGQIDINGGTLVANLSNNTTNPTSSALGNPQAVRNINVNNGGTLKFNLGDTFGGNATAVVSTLVINAGGIVTNAGNNFTTFGPLQLNGGTLTGTGGAVATFQMYSLQGLVTVGGSVPSTISGSGTNAGYHLSANTTFNVADATGNATSDLNVSGILIDRQNSLGAGAVTKTGVGTMTLTGANTYTGNTTVSNGTLTLATGGSLYNTATAATITVSTGANLNITSSATNVTTSSSSGATAKIWTVGGTINVTGGGAETLATTVNLNGGTLTSSGTTNAFGSYYVNVANTLITGTGANIISGNAIGIDNALTLSPTTAGTDSIAVSAILGISGHAAGSLTKTGAGTVTLSPATTNLYTGLTTISAGTLQTDTFGINGSDVANGISFGGGTLQARTATGITTSKAISGASTAKLDTTNGFITLNGAIGSTVTGVTLTGVNANAVTLGGANLYTGTTAISGTSTLIVTNTKGLGSTSNITFATGGTAALTLKTATTVLKGDGTAFAASITGPTASSGIYTINVDYSVAGGGAGVGFNQQLAALAVGTSSSAQLVVNALNLTSGAPTLNFTSASWGQSGNGNNDIITANMGVVIAGNVTNLATTTPTTNTLTLQGTATNSSIGGIISDGTVAGSTALTKAGAGTWTLSGANTYAGTTTVSTGILNIQNATGLGTTAAGTSVTSGATLQLQGGIIVGAEAITSISGVGATGATGALQNVSGTNTYGGAITLGGSTTIATDASSTLNLTNTIATGNTGLTLTFASAGTTSVSGQITGTSTGNSANASKLLKTGLGTLLLTNTSNNYTGTDANNLPLNGTTINAGTLGLNGDGNLGLTGGGAFQQILFTGNGTLQDNANNISLNSFRNIGINTGATATFDSNGNTFTINSIIQNNSGNTASGIAKSGAGTVLLTGTNTYSGTTAINVGTLSVQNGNAIPDGSAVTIANVSGAILNLVSTETIGSLAGGGATGGAVTLNGNQLLTGGDNSTTTFGGVISSTAPTTGTLVKLGTGIFTLTNSNTYTGDTFAVNGTLAFSGGGNVNNSIIRLGEVSGTNTATLSITDATGGNSVNSTIVVRPGSSGTKTINATNISGTSTYGGSVYLDAGVTVSSNTSGGTLAFTGLEFDLKVSQQLSVTGSGNTTISNVIKNTGGTGTILKQGTGMLVLSGLNTYGGQTAIDAGTIRVDTTPGTASGTTFVGNGGTTSTAATLLLGGAGGTGGGVTLSNALQANQGSSGNRVIGGSNTTGTNSFAGTLTLTDSNVTLQAATGGTVAFNTITAGSVQTMAVGTSGNTGIVSLGGTADNVNAAATVNFGTLQLAKTSSVSVHAVGNSAGTALTVNSGATAKITGTGGDQIFDSSTATVSSGGVLDLNGQSETVNVLNLNGTGISSGGALINNNGSTTSTFTASGGIALGSSSSIGGSANITTSSIISGTGFGLTKVGGGTVTLSGANSYTGATTITTGTLSIPTVDLVANANPLGQSTAAAGNLILNGGTLQATGGAAGTTDRLFSLQSSSTIDASGSAALIFSNTGSMGFNGGTAAKTLTLTGSNTNANSLAAIIGNNTGATTVNKSGAGNWTLSGNNTYTGTTGVSNGTLIMSGDNTLTGQITVSGNTGATLTLSGNNSGMTSNVLLNTSFPASGTASPRININSATALGTGTLTFGGGAATDTVRLDNTSAGLVTVTTNNVFTINRSFTFVGTQSLNLGNMTATLSGVTAGTQRGIVVTANTLTFGGVIGETAALNTGINKSGAGTLVLTGTNTNTGGTTISAGTLVMANTQALGTGAGSGALVSIGGGTLDIQTAGSDTAYNFSLGSGTTGTIISNVASGTTGIDHTMGSINIGGNTTVGATRLNITAGTGLTGTPTITFSGLSMTSGNANGVSTLNPTTAGLIVGTVTATSQPKVLNLDGTNTGNQITGIISDGTGVSITKTNTSTWTLSGTNTYTGATSVSGGILQVNVNDALGTNAAGTSVATGSVLKLNGVNYSTAEALSINGTGISGGGALVNTGTSTYAGLITAVTSATINAGGGTLNLTGGLVKNGTTLTLTGGGTINISGTGISGASANSDLVVNGTTVNLNVTSSYNGPTSVIGAGTLVLGINNAIPSNSAVTLGDASTTGTLTLSTFTNNIGSLSFGAGGGTLKLAANQTGTAQLNASGTVILGAGVNAIDLTGMANSAGLYRIVSGSSLTGTFGSVTGLDSAYSLVYSGTELDAQHKAAITLALGSNAANVHVGGQTVNLSIGNTAPTGSATLNYTLGGVTGSGTRAPQVTSAATGSYTAVAGVNSFNITATDAAATNSPQTVAFSQTGYNLAAAAATQTVNVGNYRVGTSTTAGVTLGNTAPTNATYTETLSSNGFSGTTANFTATGSASGIAGGGTGSGTLLVGVGAGLGAGVQSGTTTLALNSDAVNGSGLGTTSVGNQTITINATGYNPASAATSQTVTLNTRPGVGVSTNLSVTNSGAASAPYQETLGSTGFSTPTTGYTANGSITGLAGGATSSNGSLTVGVLGTTINSSGSYSGSTTLGLQTQAVNSSGLGNAAITAQTVGINVNVYAYADAIISKASGDGAFGGSGTAYTLDFGNNLALNTNYTATINLANGLFDAFKDSLAGAYGTVSGPFSETANNFGSLASGNSDVFTINFFTGSTGSFTDTLTFNGTSLNGVLGNSALPGGAINISLMGTAIPEPNVAALIGGFGVLALLRRRR